jgi:ribosomal-protein-alanine N-acetyltransferase
LAIAIKNPSDKDGLAVYDDLRIGYAHPEDLPAIYTIERRSFSPHWSYRSLEEEVCRPRSYTNVLVARCESEVVAFTVFWGVYDEAHILNFAVHPDHRRHGVGMRLMEAILDRASALGLSRVTLEVRVSNHAAIQLYRKIGFAPVAIRRRFYHDNGEDAYVMWIEGIGKRPPAR